MSRTLRLEIRASVVRMRKAVAGVAAAGGLAGSLFAFGGQAFAASCYNQTVGIYDNWGIGVSGSWTVNGDGTINYGSTGYTEFAYYPLSWEGTYSEWQTQTPTYGQAESVGLLVETIAGVIIQEGTESAYCGT